MDSSRKHTNSAIPGKPSPPLSHNANNQGVATLIVMIAVLVIIVLFCCFAAPGIRGLCKRYIFRTCDIDDPDIDNASRITEEASPAVILLPNGRMLLVDRRILRRSDDSVPPFLGTLGSTPSILDSSETSKGVSPTSLGYPPPNYEDVFPHLLDLPPSYSEISLLAKNIEAMEMVAMDRNSGPAFGTSEAASDGSHEAVASVGSGFEADDVSNADEVIEVIGSNGISSANSGGECIVDVNSDQNTAMAVENNVNRTSYDL